MKVVGNWLDQRGYLTDPTRCASSLLLRGRPGSVDGGQRQRRIAKCACQWELAGRTRARTIPPNKPFLRARGPAMHDALGSSSVAGNGKLVAVRNRAAEHEGRGPPRRRRQRVRTGLNLPLRWSTKMPRVYPGRFVRRSRR